jgi:hypothetical protein
MPAEQFSFHSQAVCFFGKTIVPLLSTTVDVIIKE